MTSEQELSGADVVRAVRQVLNELAPQADSQDVDDFIETLNGGDPDELEVNLGAGFGQFFDEQGTDAAFERYAQLIGAERVEHNPIPRPVTND